MFFLAFLEKDIRLYCILREKIFFFEKNKNSKFSFLHKFSESFDKDKTGNNNGYEGDHANNFYTSKPAERSNSFAYQNDDYSKIHEELKIDFEENISRVPYVQNLVKNLVEKREEKITRVLLDTYQKEFWNIKPLLDRETLETIINKDRMDIVSHIALTLFLAKNNRIQEYFTNQGVKNVPVSALFEKKIKKKEKINSLNPTKNLI